MKKILKVDESRLQEAANNDVILAEFGKSWINSGVEKLLIKERLNEGSIERLQHAIESHKILLSTVFIRIFLDERKMRWMNLKKL